MALLTLNRPPQVAPRRPLTGQTVLVVAPSITVFAALQRAGARLRHADGHAAMLRHLASYRPSFVIVDMAQGVEALHDAVRFLPGQRSLIALGDRGDRAAALEAGATGFITLPVTEAALLTLLLGGVWGGNVIAFPRRPCPMEAPAV